jgi:hypothetical protein
MRRDGGHGASRLCPPYAIPPRPRVPAAHDTRVFPSILPSSKQRAQGRPGAGWHPWSACRKKHAAEPQAQPKTSGLPCAMVLRLIRDLPGDQALLPPSPADRSADLAPTLGRQDHTISPSAGNVIRLMTCRVHHISLPTSVTIAKRPSCGCETRGRIVLICPTAQGKMCTTGSSRMAGMHSRDSLHVIASASEAIQTSSAASVWIASSLRSSQ